MELWKQLTVEHGIGRDGLAIGSCNDSVDRKDVFFYQVNPFDDYVTPTSFFKL